MARMTAEQAAKRLGQVFASVALQLAELNGMDVTMGVQGREASQPKKERTADGRVEESGTPLVVVAAAHERGIGVPRRSFLQAPIEQARPVLRGQLRRELDKAIRTGALKWDEKRDRFLTPTVQALGRIGVYMRAVSQTAIRQGIPPELSDKTIARKGSTVPLIDTGQLRGSLRWQVERHGKVEMSDTRGGP